MYADHKNAEQTRDREGDLIFFVILNTELN
jgi:hypothetical protein